MIDTDRALNNLTGPMEQGGRIRMEGLTRNEADYLKSRLNGHNGYRLISIHHQDIVDNLNAYINGWNCNMVLLYCEGFRPSARVLTISDLVKP